MNQAMTASQSLTLRKSLSPKGKQAAILRRTVTARTIIIGVSGNSGCLIQHTGMRTCKRGMGASKTRGLRRGLRGRTGRGRPVRGLEMVSFRRVS